LQGKGASSKITMKDDGSVLINSDGQDWVKGKNWEKFVLDQNLPLNLVKKSKGKKEIVLSIGEKDKKIPH
jgi:hypothetical protein